MEHEFVPGKRRCVHCRMKLNEATWLDFDAGTPLGCPVEIGSPYDQLGPEPREGAKPLKASGPLFVGPAPEPEKPPQTWHLNVWTSVNDVIFTAQAEATDEVTNGQALQEKMVGSVLWAVKEITAEYTPREETE